jgi:hypothetical protein
MAQRRYAVGDPLLMPTDTVLKRIRKPVCYKTGTTLILARILRHVADPIHRCFIFTHLVLIRLVTEECVLLAVNLDFGSSRCTRVGPCPCLHSSPMIQLGVQRQLALCHLFSDPFSNFLSFPIRLWSDFSLGRKEGYVFFSSGIVLLQVSVTFIRNICASYQNIVQIDPELVDLCSNCFLFTRVICFLQPRPRLLEFTSNLLSF